MEVDEVKPRASSTAGAAEPVADAAVGAPAATVQPAAAGHVQKPGGERPGRFGGERHDGPKQRGKQGRKAREPWNNRGEDGRPMKRYRFQREDKAGEGEEVPQSKMRIVFSAEEIAAEERRPKHKVAVLIGYAGTGYRGMQINHDDKTIEGDLFAAFVAAGAIAKKNADEPKKSGLVRCARTDKGVHAAGNVISLKLIVEDEDVVERINAHLPEQIRVWGIRRALKSFSCYQACDSRWYEYLLPSYALLPPHPESFLGRAMVESAKKVGGDAYDEMVRRLDDVRDFWADTERDVVAPLLAALAPEVRRIVAEKLHSTEEFLASGHRKLEDLETVAERNVLAKEAKEAEKVEAAAEKTEPVDKVAPVEKMEPAKDTEMDVDGAKTETLEAVTEAASTVPPTEAAPTPTQPDIPEELKPAVDEALRTIKAAVVAAKRRYRVTPTRLDQLQEALTQYEGTRNFHNYTVQKTFRDASAKRHIKSFVVNPQPIQIGETEWLSLRVHGQSFMMHQIRKMVAMAVMVTRCGTPPGPAMALSYGPRRISIPRAPGFGLLLERPVFDGYNKRAEGEFGKIPIDFGHFEKEIRAFKDREIYARIWDVEESQSLFHAFFHQLDNYHTSYYLWAVPGGFDAAFERFGRAEAEPAPAALPGDEDEEAADGEGEG